MAEVPEPAAAEEVPGDDLRRLLDRELSFLPAKYRGPVVLCDLEGLTRKEVARQLGCPEGTVAGRLARARVMLAKRLARLGVVVSGGALPLVLSQASASVPPSVVSSTITVASRFAAGPVAVAGAVLVNVATLMDGVMRAMFMTKLKAVTAALLIVAGVGISRSLLVRYNPAAAQPADHRSPWAGGGRPLSQARNGPHVVGVGINSDAGLTGSVFTGGSRAQAGQPDNPPRLAGPVDIRTVVPDRTNGESDRPKGREVNSAKSDLAVAESRVRAMRIPVAIDPAHRAGLKRLHLIVSADGGKTWHKEATMTPDEDAFSFHAPADGLYWLSIQTVSRDGKKEPNDLRGKIQPTLKVLVNTTEDRKGPKA
jgi:hypothetical protein